MDNIKSAIDVVMAVGPTVWKYVTYQTCHNDYMSEFKEMQGKLKRRLSDVDANVKTQLERPRKIAKMEVEAWRKKARLETAEDVVEDLICREGFFTNIRSSRKLDEKAKELNRMFMEGENYTKTGQSLVVDDPSFKGVPLTIEECSFRDDTQRQILEWLKGDQVTRIAVWGMGGVGKTTIMKQVHNQLLEESKFNKVIWEKVSKDYDIFVQQKTEFDILKFQKRIASRLELELKKEDLENETKLAGLISQKLGQGSYVLILDDVWQQFCPEDVGIPDLVGNNGCKLVLTTRVQHVARVMDFKVIPVSPLPADEALALFLEKVGNDVLSDGIIKRDIEPFLMQILQKCNGVPLAIVTVAKSMRGKLDPRSWKWALSKLSKFEEIVDRLKFSYDCLESTCQECFLYCALYPEDHEIPKEELIECWIDEGFIYKEGETRDTMNCEGYVMLDKLVDNSLLQSVKNWHEEDCVSMHDLLREMALNISPQFLVKAGMASEKLPEEHEWKEDLLKVSLMRNYIAKIPSNMLSPKCTMLTTLLLSNNKISTIPEAFFDHMPGLKILDLSENSELCCLPSSISKLEKLSTLLLGGCDSLTEVPSLSNLGGLKKLDLSRTSTEELPQGLNMLTNMKYLCLDGKVCPHGFRRPYCSRFGEPDEVGGRLSRIPDGLLQNLSKLQHLKVDCSISLKVEEIGRLGKLEYLKGRFSRVHDMSIFVNSGMGGKFLNMYTLFVGSYNYHFNFYTKLKTIVCCDIDICGEPKWLPSDVQDLIIFNCKDVRRLNDISGFQDATNLLCVHIVGCDGMECSLSGPWLNSLQNLEEVGAVAKLAPLPAGTFSSLESIIVESCYTMKKLFSIRWLGYLQNLQSIMLKFCHQMEEIIWSEYEEGEKALEKVTLPKLRWLDLTWMPQFKSIYSNSSTVLICDSIEKIHINISDSIENIFWPGFNPLSTLEVLDLANLKNLKLVFDEKALGLSPPLATTPIIPFALKKIHVQICHQLKKVFSSRWLLSYFQGLETIWVHSCNQMEELISSSAYEEEKVTLPNLQSLELVHLATFKSICNRSIVLICDSIKNIQLINCQNIESVFWSGFNPLPTLEYLYLLKLKNLKSVFDEEALGLLPLLPPTTFFSLKRIKVEGCHQLKKVFSSGWLLGYFRFLETIEVGYCSQMEELISSSAYEEEKLTLPKLQRLELTKLPSLKSICSSSNNVLICDSIERLQIVGCKKLKRIPLNFPLLDNAQSSHPSSLKEIVVFPKELWESLEWNHPNAKDILLPFCKFQFESPFHGSPFELVDSEEIDEEEL